MHYFLYRLATVLLLLTMAAHAEELTIERLVASPAITGPAAKGVKISPDGSRVTFLQGKAEDQEQQDLWEYHIADGKKRMLVDSRQLHSGEESLDEVELARRQRARIFARGIIEYTWSEDGAALLFPLGGDIYYLKLGSEPRRLTNTDTTETDAKVSPLGRYVSYIRQQNLVIFDLETGTERALTTDGADAISYGMAEFVAQEEMRRKTGYWWSPDDSRIAYTRVDESGVKLINRYEIGAEGVTSVPQRYPFAGTANAVVELFVIELASGKVREVDLGEDKDFYLARAKYSPDGTLAVQKQSRDQKTLDLIFVDPDSFTQKIVLTEHQPRWVDLHDDLNFINNGARFTWTSMRSGFNHIYLYKKDGTLERRLTDGEWMVSQTGRSGGGVRAVDEVSETVWFTGWRKTPTEKHLYRVSFSGGEIEQMTEGQGWHDAFVAKDGSFYVEDGDGPARPPYTAIRASSGQLLTYVNENALDEAHPYYPYWENHRPYQYGTLTIEEGTELQYRVMLPADFDSSKKYPAIVYLYGGPGSGVVAKRWPINGRQAGLAQILAQRGYVVYTIDNRGTSNRGSAFEEVLFRNMGDFEVRDQLEGVEWLKSQPYVDADNVGIFGGSYGGYMVLLCLLKAPGTFAAGIASAPVTNWRLYDTHYTEHYMGDPNDGDGRYEIASPMTYADNLADNLLIIHGMADDNVVFDNTVQMIDALQERSKPFEMMTYPGKRHRITGEAENIHLWNLHLEFFDRHLKGK